MQELSELHKAARRYAEAGIAVFPVEVNGKKPVTPNGFYDASTDVQQIDRWWSQADYNLAMSPGQNNLFVVDLDPGYEIKGELPDTYTVRTPRGGLHLYYEGSGPTTASKLGPHVDTRGAGGYVLLPPSQIMGKRYAKEGAQDVPYAPIPQWIKDGLTVPEREIKAAAVDDLDLPINVSRATDFLAKSLAAGEVAVEGRGGDELTYRLACAVRDFGLSEIKTFELLAAEWNIYCRPPWSDEELQQKVLNAYAYGQNEAGAYGIEPPQKVFGDIVARLYPVKHSRFYFKDESEFENEPDPQWLVKELLTERSTALLFGPTQNYKSFIALLIALGISTATPTCGCETLAGKVFYCALEGRAHLRKAIKSWKLGNGVDRIRNFWLGRAPIIGINNEVEDFLAELQSRCGDEKPRLIIIDTLTKAMAGLNENDAKDAGQFIQFCDALVETFSCSVLVIHHSGKDQTKGARGSSAFPAGFDTVLEVVADRKTKAVAVHVRKHKDAEERAEPFTFEGRIVGPSLFFSPTTAKEHQTLTHEESEYCPRKIGAALQKLGAFGEEKAVTTAILAIELVVRDQSMSENSYQNDLARTSRALHKLGKEQLEAYTLKNGKITKWMLPAQ